MSSSPHGAGPLPAPVAAPAAVPAAHDLTTREEEVLVLIAWGYSNKEIAARLRLSVKTVETYKTRGLEKLEVRGRPGLVRHAVRAGWLVEGGAFDPAPLPEPDARRGPAGDAQAL